MSLCKVISSIFDEYITEIDSAAAIDKMKDKPLRYNVWETTSQNIRDVFTSGIKALPKNEKGNGNSPHVLKKVQSGTLRVKDSTELETVDAFIEDIINNDENIGMSIALHEILETVKGEVDKARNNSIAITDVSSSGTLPAIPLSRIAANIGRTIAFQMGYRFTSTKENTKTAIQIETLYYAAGKRAVELLKEKEYLNIHSSLPSIKDYINRNEIKKEYVGKTEPTKPGKHVLSISLNEKKLGIKKGTRGYFLNRTATDLNDTKLGVITDMLRVVRQITQASTLVLPHTNDKKVLTHEDLRKLDDDNTKPDKIMDDVRTDMYNSPLKVNNSVHGLMNLLNKKINSSSTLVSGSEIISKGLHGNKKLMRSLFGIKSSDDFSQDKKESISGQNLSKTTPLDDLSENYNIIQEEGSDPTELHFPMFMGRNGRLYYYPSVLNAHGSKHSRYSLTSGEYTVDMKAAGFKTHAYNIWEAFGKDKTISFADIKGETNRFDKALKNYLLYEEYVEKGKLTDAISELGQLAGYFPGVDYVRILTGLKAIQDIQIAEDGIVTTEFMSAADATASGGTQTIVQAAGTNTEVTEFLQDLGLLEHSDGSVEVKMRDLYAIMEKGIQDFIDGVRIPRFPDQNIDEVTEDTPLSGDRLIMSKTVDLLFTDKDGNRDLRSLSKDPTMVFVYKQGKAGSIETMSSNLADRIIDNLDNEQVLEYLGILFKDSDIDINFKKVNPEALLNREGFYKEIQDQIKDHKITENLRTILDATMSKFLGEYDTRAEEVWQFVKDIHKLKALPAGAVLSNKKLMDGGAPSLAYIKEFGMPISKVFEVGNEVEGTNDIVLTREQKVSRSVADVSMIHGIDAAQLYHAIHRAQIKLGRKVNVITVHDQVIGSVEDVAAVTEAYRDVSKDIAMHYDTHQQLMYAALAYNPKLVEDEDFKALLTKINEDVAEKKRIMETQFNNETDALIGDTQAIKDFTDPTPKDTSPKPTKTKVKEEVKETSDQTEKSLFANKRKSDEELDAEYDIALNNDEDMRKEQEALSKTEEGKKILNQRVSDFISKVLPKSPLLTRFLTLARVSATSVNEHEQFFQGLMVINQDRDVNRDSYNPRKDRVTITGTDPRNNDKKLDLNNEEDLATQVEIVEHEILHAYTTPYLAKVRDGNATTEEIANIQYVEKAIKVLKDLNKKGRLKGLSERAQARVKYIIEQETLNSAIGEFISIMEGEPSVSGEIYQALSTGISQKTLRTKISQIIESIKKAFMELTNKEFDEDLDIEILKKSLANIIAAGIDLRENHSNEFDKARQKADQILRDAEGDSFLGINKQTKTTTDAEERAKGNISYLNYAVASMLNSRMEKGGIKLVGSVHGMMKRVFPMYTDVSDKIAGFIDESEAFGQLYHSITGEGANKTIKADLLAQSNKVLSRQTAVINDQLGKFHKLLTPLSEAQKKVIGRFVTEMPLHDYFTLAKEFVTEDAIASEVTRLEKQIRKIDHKAIKEVNDLISFNVEHKKSNQGRVYSLETNYPLSKDAKFNRKVHKLLALKSIQTIGAKDFETFLENTDLVNLIKDTSMANKLSLMENLGEGNLNDSLVAEYYKENFSTEVFELKDLKRYEMKENLGWKVLRYPTSSSLGIAYKPVIDSTVLLGAYTDVNLKSNDINIRDDKYKYKEVVKGANETYKLRLTEEEKETLGLVKDWSQRLVRGTSHSMAVQESQILRDGVLKKETRMLLNKNTIQNLEDKIAADNIENPWIIKFEEGMKWSDIPMDSPIRRKYKQINNASKVRGFNEEVDLVRKDISFWLMGGNAKSLFENPTYKWMIRIVKDLIAVSKIGMVVMNPGKIVNDNISNISYLGVMGVPPLFIASSYKNIAQDFQKYSDIERQIVQLTIKSIAKPKNKKLQTQLKNLRRRAETETSLGDISDKGFINSLGSDLVAKNADTLSGLQADMHTALEYLLLKKGGDRNALGDFMVNLQGLGFKGEGFFKYLGDKMKRYGGEMGTGIEHELDQVYERLTTIRSEEDVINYVSQYTNSPGSEFVRLGASMTDLTDVMAKETLYRHLTVNEGVSPEKARIKVLDSFPDYKENMPLAVKQLSDLGIIMFPSFWLRIQKVIYRMIRDKPLNLATELMLEEAFGKNINTILDANIISKSTAFGGVLHTPLEPVGWTSPFPIHVFG